MWWSNTPWAFLGPGMIVTFVIVCIALIALLMRGGTAGRPQR